MQHHQHIYLPKPESIVETYCRHVVAVQHITAAYETWVHRHAGAKSEEVEDEQEDKDIQQTTENTTVDMTPVSVDENLVKQLQAFQLDDVPRLCAERKAWMHAAETAVSIPNREVKIDLDEVYDMVMNSTRAAALYERWDRARRIKLPTIKVSAKLRAQHRHDLLVAYADTVRIALETYRQQPEHTPTFAELFISTKQLYEERMAQRTDAEFRHKLFQLLEK